MKKIIPHALAVLIFYILLVILFTPVFTKNKIISQHDAQQWLGTAKSVMDYRKNTGQEALWVPSVFSGMPAYLVSVVWSNKPIVFLKKLFSFGMSTPLANTFICMVGFYVLLLSFGIRPLLAIIGAVSFGLSTYIIIGVLAGHNARIGSIGFLPLVLAGVHLIFEKKRYLGFSLVLLGLSLHLRESHLQITYYSIFLLVGYFTMRFTVSIKIDGLLDFGKSTILVLLAGLISLATVFGQLWSTYEYSKYSTRGQSELIGTNPEQLSHPRGLNKEYAFEYSNGLIEPLTLLIPNFQGGSSNDFLANTNGSKTHQVLTKLNNTIADQLASRSSSYWGDQPLSMPYYSGAVLLFLFGFGLMYAERKWVWWLGSTSVLCIVLSWGSNFKLFNYYIFDHLPAYSKFRSVTFIMAIFLIASNLLAFLGLEKLIKEGISKESQKKFLKAFYIILGTCFVFFLFAGQLSLTKDAEKDLPEWFVSALQFDRASLIRMDALRSILLIVISAGIIWIFLKKYFSYYLFFGLLLAVITFDLVGINKRLIKEESFRRNSESNSFQATMADLEILKDKSYYRVYDIRNTFNEAHTSYFHNSLGGYHGAKLMRFQQLFDSCIVRNTQDLISDAQSQSIDFQKYWIINMLNVKYIVYGDEISNIMKNPAAIGPAWFINTILKVNNANNEIKTLQSIDTRLTCVIDTSKYTINNFGYDPHAQINITERSPSSITYKTSSDVNSFAVFSEIYYPSGWIATIDGKNTEIKRVNYTLRGLEVPSGNHLINFIFKPNSYYFGNIITSVSSWIVLILIFSLLFIEVRNRIRKST